jgi:predicted DNA-binding antitoxin AbrB/MazE fold protein
MSTIRAIYEGGVFRPKGPVGLPERCVVEFDPKVVEADTPEGKGLAGVYEVLCRRYETGQPDLAARHDEHQP